MTDQLRDKARALGLDRLTDEHLAQFERATAAAMIAIGRETVNIGDI
jgi:hypothetical protein